MRTTRPAALLVLTTLSLCLGACIASPGQSAADREAQDAEAALDAELAKMPTPTTAQKPPTPTTGPRSVEAAPGPLDTTVHYLNVNMEVDDPVGAMEKARKAVEELGGEVTNAYSSGDNANITARIEEGKRGELRDLVTPLGNRVTNENMSSNDMGHEIRRLRGRSRKISNAEREMFSGTGGSSPDTLALVRELLDRERQSVDSQLNSYRDQIGAAHVNIAFTKSNR